jgi:glycosyltransferase involved in cell wall biosynthesis
MKISIVTPTWNRARQLQSSIDSVTCQQHYPWEHIIVDNMSTDETTEVVRGYAQAVTYPVRHIREKDGGIYEAMNKGLALATGDVLYFLNDDDMLYAPEVLEIMGQCLKFAKADLVFGDVVLLCAEGQQIQSYRRHRQLNRLTLVERTITQQAIFYRREVFRRCGGFDTGLRIAADHEWLLRAFLRHDIQGIYLKRPVAKFRAGGVSNDAASQEIHRKEREAVTMNYFSKREVTAARLYRRLLRKVPLGATLLNLVVPLRLNVQSVREKNGRFVPDPLSWLDL